MDTREHSSFISIGKILTIYVAAALDPRYKMRWVKWMIEETYPAPEASYLIKKITEAMEKLFKHYKSELELQDSLESPQKKGKSA